MRTHLTTAAAAALLLVAGAAVAQETEFNTGQLDYVDTTDDGAVTIDEFRALMQTSFDALDVNKDGLVSAAEAGTVIVPTNFAVIDVNKDGSITFAELDAQLTADFAASDRNADGSLN